MNPKDYKERNMHTVCMYNDTFGPLIFISVFFVKLHIGGIIQISPVVYISQDGYSMKLRRTHVLQ